MESRKRDLKLLRKYLDCQICDDLFYEPKILSCLHTYCCKCLMRHLDILNNRVSFFCSICTETILLENGPSGAEDNVMFGKFIRRLYYDIASGNSECISCRVSSTAMHYCLECKEGLCSDCLRCHRNVRVTREHNVLDIEEYKVSDSTTEEILCDMCSLCENRRVEVYCTTCERCICRRCMDEHKAMGHDFMAVGEAYAEEKSKMEEKLSRLGEAEEENGVVLSDKDILLQKSCRSRGFAELVLEQGSSSELLTMKTIINNRLEDLTARLRGENNIEFSEDHEVKNTQESREDKMVDKTSSQNKSTPLPDYDHKERESVDKGNNRQDSPIGKEEKPQGRVSKQNGIREPNGPQGIKLRDDKDANDPRRVGKDDQRKINGNDNPTLRTKPDSDSDNDKKKASHDNSSLRNDNKPKSTVMDNGEVKGDRDERGRNVDIEASEVVELTDVYKSLNDPEFNPKEDQIMNREYSSDEEVEKIMKENEEVPKLGSFLFGFENEKENEDENELRQSLVQDGDLLDLSDITIYGANLNGRVSCGRLCQIAVEFPKSWSPEVVENARAGLTVKVQSLDGSIVHVTMTNHSQYNTVATFRLMTSGSALVLVTLSEHHIAESPYVIVVTQGRNFSDEAEDNEWLCFGKTGENEGEFQQPCGVAVTSQDNIIVCDSNNHRVQVFDEEGEFLWCFGTSGSDSGQFRHPSGVAVLPDGKIAISDSWNNRIQIFTQDGEYLKEFGERGSSRGQLYLPMGVAVDSCGRIIVGEQGNHRVQVFDSEGNHLLHFGQIGSDIGEFRTPGFVAVDLSDNIYVSDQSNGRVQVFDKTGNFLRQIQPFDVTTGTSLPPMLSGVAIDITGNVIVGEKRSCLVQVMSQDGELVRQFGGKGSSEKECHFPVGLALFSDARLIVTDWYNNRVHVF